MLLLFFIYFSRQYLTKVIRPTPLHLLSMLFSSIWESFLAKASMMLLFQYGATLSRRKGSDLFRHSGPFLNFQIFLHKLTWSQKAFCASIAWLSVVMPKLCHALNWGEWVWLITSFDPTHKSICNNKKRAFLFYDFCMFCMMES